MQGATLDIYRAVMAGRRRIVAPAAPRPAGADVKP